MKLEAIDRDLVSGILLMKDDSDPPRYYVQWKQRRELIAIGDVGLARQRFSIWRARGMEKLLAAEEARRESEGRQHPPRAIRQGRPESEDTAV